MTIHAFMRRAGKSTVRRVGLLLVAVLILSGCGRNAQLFAVKAVAAGVPSLAPFFDERGHLGEDAAVQVRRAPGGLQAGNTPGLYGGSRKPSVCDVELLKEFLTAPRNARKAEVWAQVEGITRAEIPAYLDRLTPVLLRHDTLVENHDYKKDRAAPFNSLLQAGIAVLVNRQGQPAVKCSCGNPLRTFQGDTTRISVKFAGRNKKWAGYDRASVVAVKPSARPLTRLALVDVDDPDRGMDRPVGTTGGHDKPFDIRVRHKVPDVTGMTFASAAQRLTAEGLAVAYAGTGAPPDGAAVTSSDPGPGALLEFGRYVTLSVDAAETDGPGGSAPDGTAGGSGGGPGSGANGGTSAPPSSGAATSRGTGTSPGTPTGSGTASSPPASRGTSSPSGSDRTPASGSTAPASSTPATGTTDPPSAGTTATGGAPVTSAAASGGATTGKPATSAATAGKPTTSARTTGKPTTSSPTTHKPSSGSPTTNTPTAGKPSISTPATVRSATGTPATSEPPVARDPVTGSPSAGTT